MFTRLFHFTSQRHLPYILGSNALRAGDNMTSIARNADNYDPAVVWLLDVDTLPPLDPSKPITQQPHALYPEKRNIRFTVDVPTLWVRRWKDWDLVARMDYEWRKVVIETGGGDEMASRWYVCLRHIPQPYWKQITDMTTGEDVKF